jgi:hypothetical protein
MPSEMIQNLRERRQLVWLEAKALADKAANENRAFDEQEERSWQALNADLDSFDARLKQIREQEQSAEDIETAFNNLHARPVDRSALGATGNHVPGILDVSQEHLDVVQKLLDTRATGRFDPVETRAALTTSTFGSPRGWGSNVLDDPRQLWAVARIPVQEVAAVAAQHPKFTLPTASAVVSEGASLGEYATSAGTTVTLGRYGRWTDLTAESRVGTDARGLLSMHRVGIALDLEKIVVVEATAAAGAAVAFSTPVVDAIRKALAQVRANTASGTPDNEFVLCNPADAALLQSVTPTGGESIGQPYPKFSGANVFETNAIVAGFMTVANLSAGMRFYQAQPLGTATLVDVKTGIQTFATSVIAGVGSTMTSYSISVDVVTP